MHLLLTNDDGIDAPGLAQLAAAVADQGCITEFAPQTNCSAAGHSITIDRAVRVHHLPDDANGVHRYAVEGTPADAIKFALKHHCEAKPDLVLSGINAGPNVGVNVLYSGTVAAAMEANIHGVSSLAVSVADFDRPHYETAAHFTRRVLPLALALEDERLAEGAGPPFCLNLNVPGLPVGEVKGLRITRHGRSGFDESFQDAGDGAYRMDGVMRVHDPDDSFCAAALAAGYASLTPLKIDLTDEDLMTLLLERLAAQEGRAPA